MLITLTAALSLAAALAIDVPYLPQTDALCGGAAAAMVFRYWGDAHADAQAFAPLVDRRAGGIATGALTAAVSARGWRTGHVETLAALGARVRDGQPVIVLLPDRGDRYHYVVVIGASEEAIVVHDPAWGPSRTIPRAGFRARVGGGRLLVAGDPSSADGRPFRQTGLASESPRGCGAGRSGPADCRRVRRAVERRPRPDPLAGTRSGGQSARRRSRAVSWRGRPDPGAERRAIRTAALERRGGARARGAAAPAARRVRARRPRFQPLHAAR